MELLPLVLMECYIRDVILPVHVKTSASLLLMQPFLRALAHWVSQHTWSSPKVQLSAFDQGAGNGHSFSFLPRLRTSNPTKQPLNGDVVLQVWQGLSISALKLTSRLDLSAKNALWQ